LPTNQGYQVKGDVRINGQPASLDYRKPSEGDADVNCRRRSTMRAAQSLASILARRSAAPIPIKLIGKIGGPDRDKPRRRRCRSDRL